MNQVYRGNYQSYQPSYHAPSLGQWTAPSYHQGCNGYYSAKTSATPYEPYDRKSYSSPCMGQCNPPKLYADTFNYLTENLMKPVIEEVYQDLKSITAANTVVNNSAAAKIGLPAQDQTAQVRQNAHGQNQILVDAVPLSTGLIQGQLHNVAAVRQATLPSQVGTPFQQNTARRNGIQV